MFRLPKECITGHVEGWTFSCVLLIAIIFTGLPANLLFGGFLAGQTLKMLIHMSQAKRVLEIGMFTGYGALSMAEGLPEDGCLIACELESYLKDFAQPIFDKSPHGKKITVKTGSAMHTLKVRERKTINIEGLSGKRSFRRLNGLFCKLIIHLHFF